MDIYSNLLEKYKDYLEKEEVQDTDEVISAYTLWNLIKEKLKMYNFIKNDNSSLLANINSRYKLEYQATFWSGTDLYDLAIKNFDTKIPLFRPVQFIGIKSGYTNNNKTAVFSFILRTKVTENKERVNEEIKVYRDFGDDNYYGDHINSFLIYNCKELLDSKVDFLESFAPIVTAIENKTCPSSQIIDNGILNINMNHSLEGTPSLSVKLSKSIDPNDSQFKNYSSAFCPVHVLMREKYEELLKRTPVEIKDLNHFCSIIVKQHLAWVNYEKEHAKTLVITKS